MVLHCQLAQRWAHPARRSIGSSGVLLLLLLALASVLPGAVLLLRRATAEGAAAAAGVRDLVDGVGLERCEV